MFTFFKSRQAQALTVIFLLMGGVFYARALGEFVPRNPDLALLPRDLNRWHMFQESAIDAQTEAVLKADNTLNRTYTDGADSANLFVAFFRTQRAGVSPHSPKVCLPGAGWMPTQSDTLTVPIEGGQPLSATRYVIARGENKNLVVYWFQTPYRTIANEYMARFYLITDALRYHRSDTSLVRVIVPILNDNVDLATQKATAFIQSFYVPLTATLTS